MALDDDARPRSALERLPSLVLRELLSILQLPDIKALVYASPVFYTQYSLDRGYVVPRSLLLTLGCVYIDAAAVLKSFSSHFQRTRSKETVLQFLESYGQQMSSIEAPTSASDAIKDEATAMASFYMTSIAPLIDTYSNWALCNLDTAVKDLMTDDNSETAESQGPISRLLSLSEKTRISRALYRFQVFCNLFGAQARAERNSGTSLSFQPVDILVSFFSLFEPWEVEEILCIYSLAKETISHVFEVIGWDVNNKNPKYDDQRPPTPEGAFDMDDGWTREMLLQGTVSRGLMPLRTLIMRHQDHKSLVRFMQDTIMLPAGAVLDAETMSDTMQLLRRERHPSDRDTKEANRDPLPFKGDDGLHGDELRPPLAWTMIWGGTYSNLYGTYVQDDIRRWGYVMWDADRLRATGADQALAKQWEMDWEEDPRDNLF